MKIFHAILATIVLVSYAKAETAWETYVKLPSSDNAMATSKIAYSSDDMWDYDYQHIGILRTQISAGDVEAFRLGFRARKYADGALLEYLNEVTSRLIRLKPKEFLIQMQELNATDDDLESILLMVGEEYVDLFDARRYEMRRRYDAIAEVECAELSEMRQKSLEILGSAT